MSADIKAWQSKNVAGEEYHSIWVNIEELNRDQQQMLVEGLADALYEITGFPCNSLLYKSDGLFGTHIGIPENFFEVLTDEQKQSLLAPFNARIADNKKFQDFFNQVLATREGDVHYNQTSFGEPISQHHAFSYRVKDAHGAEKGIDSAQLDAMVRRINELAGKEVASWSGGGGTYWWSPICIHDADVQTLIDSPNAEQIIHVLAHPHEFLKEMDTPAKKPGFLDEITRAGPGASNRPGAGSWAKGQAE